jgi:ribosomal protein S18 acetylase RimI-like enzyme
MGGPTALGQFRSGITVPNVKSFYAFVVDMERRFERMTIRPLLNKDREKLHSMLAATNAFTPEEIDVAMELIDIVLRDGDQKDYEIQCLVNEQDDPMGYICYGPAPMTQGTFDLYWIVVARGFQSGGVGTRLLDFLEGVVKTRKGRMILVDTSSIPSYERALTFYLRKGFEVVGRIQDYYGPGNDRITFCKRIS